MSLAEILKYSYDDYKEWEGDWELIDGYPIAMSPAPMRVHQNLSALIVTFLNNSLMERECDNCVVSIENDWKISDFTVVRPDVIFTCDDEAKAYLTKPPKIIVEIISSSTKRVDEEIKFNLYEAEGVKYYILVYPEELLARVYKLEDDKYKDLGEYKEEKLEFSDIGCALNLDFGAVFNRVK